MAKVQPLPWGLRCSQGQEMCLEDPWEVSGEVSVCCSQVSASLAKLTMHLGFSIYFLMF